MSTQQLQASRTARRWKNSPSDADDIRDRNRLERLAASAAANGDGRKGLFYRHLEDEGSLIGLNDFRRCCVDGRDRLLATPRPLP